jgi:CTP synthase (UTP-ammonia lyase)
LCSDARFRAFLDFAIGWSQADEIRTRKRTEPRPPGRSAILSGVASLMSAHSSVPKIALVGDYSPSVVAHRSIPRAFELIAAAGSAEVAWEWVATTAISDPASDLADFAAVWVVPASPDANMAGALAAIGWARVTRRPFLGTCGGFQHALIEFARNATGLDLADHAETNPRGDTLVVTPLSCPLVEKTGHIHFRTGSQLRAIYGVDSTVEGYHCNYGVNAAYRGRLEAGGMAFTAFDDAGEIRGFELPRTIHPFFVGTLFQPERGALTGGIPPLVAALVEAAINPSIAH